MADDARPRASSSVETRSSQSIGETTSAVTSSTVSGGTAQAIQGDKNVKRKQYYKERDATRVYLFEQYQAWRSLKDDLKLKMDKELAAILLEIYVTKKKRIFR